MYGVGWARPVGEDAPEDPDHGHLLDAERPGAVGPGSLSIGAWL